MSPEHVFGNMWRLLEGESITGRTSRNPHTTIIGPQVVRVHIFEDNLMSIQGTETIEVDGSNFEGLVRQIPKK